MKKIVLSFDDGRADFYTRAYPLLSKHNMPSTLNVTSGFILTPAKFVFSSADDKAMTAEQVKECYFNNVEIACHGSNHINTKADLLRNVEELEDMGIDVKNIGFASPHSTLTLNNRNENGIWSLVEEGVIKYVRSGIQIRREGIIYAVLSILDKYVHSKCLFRLLNKRNIIMNLNEPFLPSVTIFSYTTNNQIISLIESLPDNAAIVLMFHSILKPEDAGYGKDKFYWDISLFEELVSFLEKSSNIEVCTTMDLVHSRVG